MQKIIIGKKEYCALPDLHMTQVIARVDSGAQTSALHAEDIRYITRATEAWVRFDVYPDEDDPERSISCRAPLHAKRAVRSSDGYTQQRPVIITQLVLGQHQWDIELTLTNRALMGYPMLLGREAMAGRILIDPQHSFMQGGRSPLIT